MSPTEVVECSITLTTKQDREEVHGCRSYLHRQHFGIELPDPEKYSEKTSAILVRQ